ncbi:MAG: Asp-tRNA(Asn)/Glu-tRNA(Gln) amidotransferase GatCAB subunit C [Legionellales bacterium]|nr:Asp-tRNA(Asn)/Glu-tRNA(Gln) amidotransferase GatCAB subunit C [Legionellales bacterium]|tara:strand:- start:88955 stop:89251 length:297 start_codon:yes stop_codon:yes gene_type:complete
MSTIDANAVNNIAHLARLAVDNKHIPDLARDLTNILDLVEQMNQIDTQGIEPQAHPLDAKQRLRNDEVTEINQRELFMSIAPETEAGLYLVPKVIDAE